MNTITELIKLLQQISDDAEKIKSLMTKIDEMRITTDIQIVEIRTLLSKIENSYRRITIELLKMTEDKTLR